MLFWVNAEFWHYVFRDYLQRFTTVFDPDQTADSSDSTRIDNCAVFDLSRSDAVTRKREGEIVIAIDDVKSYLSKVE